MAECVPSSTSSLPKFPGCLSPMSPRSAASSVPVSATTNSFPCVAPLILLLGCGKAGMATTDPCYNAVVCAQGTSGYFFGWMGCATAIVFAKYVAFPCMLAAYACSVVRCPDAYDHPFPPSAAPSCGVLMPDDHNFPPLLPPAASAPPTARPRAAWA